MRLVVANFDCEVSFGRDAGRRLLPEVGARLAALAPLLDVFGGDRIWVGDDFSGLAETPTEILAWGETDRVAALRGSGTGAGAGDVLAVRFGPFTPELRDSLWQLHPSADVARRANDKLFAHRLASEHGFALPDSGIVSSLDEIDARIAALTSSDSWIIKVPFSAAGRDRLRRRGPLDAEQRVHAARLLERFGSLLFEPWMARRYDAGVIGILASDSLHVLPPHLQESDSTGICRSITLGSPVPDAPALTATAELAGRALHAIGYRGPFSIDAFGYDGGLQRLSEINARMSFGLVAHARAQATLSLT